MKALKISLEHGRIFVAETSDGRRAQGATLDSVLDKLVSPEHRALDFDWEPIKLLFESVQDKPGGSQVAHGQASA